MLRRWLVIALLFGVAAPLARADDLADEAEFRFRRGAELYAKRDYQGALSEFFTSNRLVHNRNVVFNIARTLEQLGRVEEAYRYYASMLDEPLPDADKRDVEASLRRLSSKVALVRVESDPPGANIYIDRRDLGVVGQTPRTLALPPRPAKVILELAGHYPEEKSISPATGRMVTVKLPLPTIYGHVSLALTPPEAAAHLDAEDGPVIESGDKVLPGRHVIWVTAPGYVSQNLPVEVPAEKSVPVRAALVSRPPPTGALVAKANVDGALIVIDGRESGFTPGVVEGVVAGEHQVSIVAEGRETFTREVAIKANERAFVDAHLRYAGPSVEAATKSLARASDAPGSITVVTREELRAFGYQTLAEALRGVRGIYLSDDRTYTYLGFRGFSPLGDYNNRVLILVDGHTVYDPWVDQAYVGREFDVDLDTVERIEIVRGGGSALYGTGAIFGVINVVHRAPDEGSHADVEGGLGSLSEEHGRATASIASGRFSALATAAVLDAANERIYVSPEPEFVAQPDGSLLPERLSVDNDGERAFHAGLRLRAGDFELHGSFNTRRKDAPVGQYAVVFGQPMTSIDTVGFLEGRYDHTFGGGASFTGRAYFDGSRFKGRYPVPSDADPSVPSPSLQFGGANSVGGELRLALPEVARNTLSVGVGIDAQLKIFEKVATEGVEGDVARDQGTEQILSAYLNDSVRLLQNVNLVAGARVDDHLQSVGLVFTPRAALVAHFYEGSTTKLMVGRAFRAPSYYERFFTDYDPTAQAGTQVAAPALEPELGQSAELEHTHPFTDEASVTGAVFYSELSQLIDLGTYSDATCATDSPDPRCGLYQYQNTPGKVSSYGAELEVRYRPGPNLLVEAWYAYQHSRTDDGLALDNSPAHTGAARVMVPVLTDVLTAATELVYNSARFAPADLTGFRSLVGEGVDWNLVLSGSYPRYRLRYQAGVYNVLDQRVELPAPGMPPGVNVAQYGRQLRLTVGATF